MGSYDRWKTRSPDDDRPPDEFDDQPEEDEMTVTNTWRDKGTFGPAIIHKEDDGSFRAVCTWCVFRIGDACTHVKPLRRISDPEDTPQWCEMREQMIRDAKQQAEDFDRFY